MDKSLKSHIIDILKAAVAAGIITFLTQLLAGLSGAPLPVDPNTAGGIATAGTYAALRMRLIS